ncbi:methylenetetrahydrofolate reductase [NAD(P)H] [Candidatus Methylospira mobilis]|uniref:Methylenetetrahydrofolate reductase n=1 Tax=Candidatus Methylospira mobilis TaxID=1808979 RepID=A0A5Q0BSR2_9GAMM|nr:methylenetetrahydrofolate reductase [NAD(P)H] [Candidatus Methylospira mobilis]QFY44716.1 methylenetetrahydrofolate reductase [NAD(P)H] [Candidatus Methylospira mobilis]
MNSQRAYPKSFSFELFPPKTEAAELALKNTVAQLRQINPSYCSVTFGAGGSTREKTFETVVSIQEGMGIACAPHISCIASTRSYIREMLDAYREQGIKRIVALRGDMPSGMLTTGELRYANELVEFIRQETGNDFHVEVAGYPEVHPQAANAEKDLLNFKRKVEAGADSAITQYFYNAEAYFRFIDDCEKQNINIPIVPGIMPITNYTQLARFSELCGADIPRWIRKRLEVFGDDRVTIRTFGIDVVSKLCRRLLEQGAPGLHFYTLNQSDATLAIWHNLGLHGNNPA